jgi:hypothetical protein
MVGAWSTSAVAAVEGARIRLVAEAHTTANHRRTGWRDAAWGETLAVTAEAHEGGAVTEDQLDEMGPIDFVVIEWPGEQPVGDVVPLIVNAVDRGIIRILDIAIMAKGDDGSIAAIDLGDLEDDSFAEFEGASTGLLGQEDLEEAAAALEPGTSAAVLVWENSWAGPIAAALRRSGGQLVASGRIPVQAILASLDAVDAPN